MASPPSRTARPLAPAGRAGAAAPSRSPRAPALIVTAELRGLGGVVLEQALLDSTSDPQKSLIAWANRLAAELDVEGVGTPRSLPGSHAGHRRVNRRAAADPTRPRRRAACRSPAEPCPRPGRPSRPRYSGWRSPKAPIDDHSRSAAAPRRDARDRHSRTPASGRRPRRSRRSRAPPGAPRPLTGAVSRHAPRAAAPCRAARAGPGGRAGRSEGTQHQRPEHQGHDHRHERRPPAAAVLDADRSPAAAPGSGPPPSPPMTAATASAADRRGRARSAGTRPGPSSPGLRPREDHQRQAASAGEAVVERPRVVAQDRRGRRARSRRSRRRRASARDAESVGQVRPRPAAGRRRPGRPRPGRRRSPPRGRPTSTEVGFSQLVTGSPRGVADRHAARRDRPDDVRRGRTASGSTRARTACRSTGAAALGSHRCAAGGEGRAAEDDPDRREEERDGEGRHDRPERPRGRRSRRRPARRSARRGWPPRPGPWSARPGCRIAAPTARRRPPSVQSPAPKSAPAQHRVGDQPDHDQRGDDVSQAHVAALGSRGQSRRRRSPRPGASARAGAAPDRRGRQRRVDHGHEARSRTGCPMRRSRPASTRMTP